MSMTERTRRILINIPSLDLLWQVLRWPPRKPKGHPGNMKRVQTSAAASHQWRTARRPKHVRESHSLACPLCDVRLRFRKGA